MLKKSLNEIVANKIIKTLKESDDKEHYLKQIINLLMSPDDTNSNIELATILMSGDMNISDEVMALGDQMFGELSKLSNTHWISFRHITELKLERKGLKQIPNGVQYCSSLERLNLAYNQITNLPDYIGSLTSLSIIWLENNQLSSLPDSLSRLDSLTHLYLNNNQLSSLPDSLGGLHSLERLYVKNNKLITLPDSLEQLKSLKELIVENNKFKTKPKVLNILRQAGCKVYV